MKFALLMLAVLLVTGIAFAIEPSNYGDFANDYVEDTTCCCPIFFVLIGAAFVGVSLARKN